MQNAYTNGSEQEPFLAHTKSVGEGQHSGKMQGHWMLAWAGKRVLRPGGIELTQQMLRALAIGPQDRVVEFAPGFGVTAGTVLRKRPLEYWGVERDPESTEYLRRKLAAPMLGSCLVLQNHPGCPLPARPWFMARRY